MQLSVAADFDALYCGYYLHGLAEVFGRSRIQFVTPPIAHDPRVLLVAVGRHQLAIDTNDSPELDPQAHEWADVYGKINAPVDLPPKVAPVGPGFGIRYAGALRAAVDVISTAHASRELLSEREHIAGFYRQLRYRKPMRAFVPARSDPKFVFHAGSLWAREAGTNAARALFLRAAKQIPGVQVVGGFAPRRTTEVPGYESLTMTHRLSYRSYLSLTKRSAAVFNTPTVMSCHGWKLGEYLALGKAIITTPLTRALPAPLEHGVHVHVVEADFDAVTDSLTRIVRDEKYRRCLERNARGYFDKYVAPRAAVAGLVRGARSAIAVDESGSFDSSGEL